MAMAVEKVKEQEPISAELLEKDPEEDDRVQLDPIVAQIPDELWLPIEDDVRLFLEEELRLADGERGDFMNDLARWKVAYAAPMPDSPKNFPIANASNFTVPVIKETVNTLAAQVAQAVTTVRPRWIFDDLAHEWDPFKEELQEFLDIVADRELNYEERVVEQVISKCKLGTAITEISHEVLERRTYKYSQDGKRSFPSVFVYKDGPGLFPIPLQKFWIRMQETDIQRARWVAKELDFTESELRQRSAQGEFFNVEEILPTPETSTDKVTETEEAVENKEPQRSTYKCFEVWFSYDLDGDGDYEEGKVLFHLDTGTFLYRRFNPFWHGLRPFVKDGYFPVDGRFFDMGICEMLEQIQAAISTKHNQRNDNATLANLKMIIKRKMMKGLQPGDPLYSGKIIEATDIWNDVREFSLSEIYPSTVNEEMILRQTAERLAGTNEGVAGAAMPVTRTGTGAQLALLQEQSKRIDIPVKASRRAVDRIGFFTIMLYMQFGTNGKSLAWMGERGRIVEAVFQLPRRVVELGLGIRAATPSSIQNKQVQRENNLALFNLLVQMYEKMAPLAQMMAPEHLPEFIHGMVRSAKKYMGNVLENFDQPDPDEILAGLTVLEKVLPRPEDFGGLEAYERGVESAEVLEGIERLERLYQEAEAVAGRRSGVADDRRDGKRSASPPGIPTRDLSGIGIGGESFTNRQVGGGGPAG
jgi:hypothetical protein